jgi:outer membrane receptor protein involved in Fe transport
VVRGGARGGLTAPDDSGDSFVTAEILGGVGWSFGNRRALWATLGITNLFDETYTEPFARLPALGRSIIVSVSFDF